MDLLPLHNGKVFVAAFTLDGFTRFVWWRPNDHEHARVIASEGKLVTFVSEEDCRIAAESLGITMEAEPAAVQDFDVAVGWLENGGDVPHDEALLLWNFAGDVARGVGAKWTDRGPDQDAVYD